MKSCRECGGRVSGEARVCAHCGVSAPGRTAAGSFLVGLLAVVMTIGLVIWVGMCALVVAA